MTLVLLLYPEDVRAPGANGELMLYIPLPDNTDTEDCRRRLLFIDHEWWVPLPPNVKSILLADIRWNQGLTA